MSIPEIPIPEPPTVPTDRTYRMAVTFLAVMCFLQLPMTLIVFSIMISFFMQGAASICMISETISQTLETMQDVDYDYEP